MSLTPEFLGDCQGLKILVIEPFFYTPHVETGLEIAERLSERNEVAYIGPDRLRCVTDETYKFTSRVQINLSRKRKVSGYLHGPIRVFTRQDIEALKRGIELPDPEQLLDLGDPDLAGVKYQGFDIGIPRQTLRPPQEPLQPLADGI